MPDEAKGVHDGDDAVCFTSGAAGAAFSAGVIHGWLASDREQPLVAAGISMGAISAAAMRRVYQEMRAAGPVGSARREQKRWKWFRRYLVAVTENPLTALWSAVPDPVDFFGKLPPVRDLSVPKQLQAGSEEARRHYYLLTRLGVWIAHLPIRVSTLATLAVMFVRRKEAYGTASLRDSLYWWSWAKLVAGLSWHVLRRPSFIYERSFATRQSRSRMPHPLLGWTLWLGNLGVMALGLGLGLAVLAVGLLIPFLAVAVLSMGLHALFGGLMSMMGAPEEAKLPIAVVVVGWVACAVAALLWLGMLLLGAAMAAKPKASHAAKPKHESGKDGGLARWMNDAARRYVFMPLDIVQGLLHPCEVERQLYELFADAPPLQPEQDVALVTVCAALESTEQVMLRCENDVVRALSAAIRIPGVFPPFKVPASDLLKIPQGGLDSTGQPKSQPWEVYHLIDGASVRTNPLPAFFEWCKHGSNWDVARKIDAASRVRPSLHVVYSVPIEYPGDVSQAPGMDCPDIVESGLQALQLEKRRDTRQEVRQTVYMSKLETLRRKALGRDAPGPRGPFAMIPDEIAPVADLETGNVFAPDPKKLMQAVAQGCRATLQTLYSAEIAAAGYQMGCASLLNKLAQGREANAARLAGLPEVCRFCTGALVSKPVQAHDGSPLGVTQSYGFTTDGPPDLAKVFPHLADETRPKVVFLGSGGVFRGAFHIGVVAAMAASEVYPDLVIGASVGALMGGALCHVTAGRQEDEPEVIFRLASLFLNVDSKVALTRTLKNATKQLGTRARSIALSPSELTRMVSRGSKADPGFAATGAPPALIDALSSLFMVPRRETAEISSEFVAGHISQAVDRFLREVRKETLASFDVRNAVIGVSMLADQARHLLGEGTAGVDLSRVQPYETGGRKPVSFFCTTSYLNARTPLLLGRDFLSGRPTWDGVSAGLCSSAFPLAFAPRQESDLLPGVGDTQRYFADGGLFDNLPFFPALEVLSAVQSSTRKGQLTWKTVREDVNRRVSKPNVFIAAGLNAEADLSEPCESLFQVKERAGSLSVNNKTESFGRAADKITKYLRAVVTESDEARAEALSQGELRFLETSVAAKVISILPADKDHINPTFAFCSSTGFKKQRVQRSIADGCFQTLAAFAEEHTLLEHTGAQRIVRLAPGTRGGARQGAGSGGACPFFGKTQHPLVCPFLRTPRAQPASAAERTERDEVIGIYEACRTDPVHLATQKSAAARGTPPPPSTQRVQAVADAAELTAAD